jgi:hypothetical protein
MKTKLLLLTTILFSVLSYSQLVFTNPTTSAITGSSATISVNFSNCNQPTNVVLQVASSSSYSPVLITQNFSNQSQSAPITANLAGLTPGTTYVYRFYAAGGQTCTSSGTVYSIDVSFATTNVGSLITEYTFNNTLNNINGNSPFSTNAGTSFVTGRDGVTANGAVNINNTGTTASILNLPFGSSQRTISVWVKLNTLNPNNFNFIYHYGANGTGNGFYLNGSNAVHFPLSPSNHTVSASNLINIWYHYVVMFDGTNSKIYRNGDLINSTPKTLNTVTNPIANLFRLGLTESGGAGFFNGAIDDLKIYNYALSQAEVTSLFMNNSLVTPVNLPSISSISSSAVTTSLATINYSLNANNGQTTSVVNYGLSSSNLSSQVVGFGASGNANASGTISMTGLTPNTQYFYQIEATNSAGTTQSSILNFTTIAVGEPIAEYNFNNTYNNVNGNTPFISGAGIALTTDRNMAANSALSLNNVGTYATIPGLPYGNSPRTISLWVKMTSFSSTGLNHMFNYGTSTTSYGAFLDPANVIHYQNRFGSNRHVASTPNPLDTWQHFVFVYDGTNSKIYKNGSFLTSVALNWSTVNSGDIFRIGLSQDYESGTFNGVLDDLKIYDYELSAFQAQELFTNNTLSTEKINQNNLEVTLYPNPATNLLTIKTVSEIKSVEIYNLQGQKILKATQKEVNISTLASGMYMVKIQDVDNKIVTKKIIKN